MKAKKILVTLLCIISILSCSESNEQILTQLATAIDNKVNDDLSKVPLDKNVLTTRPFRSMSTIEGIDNKVTLYNIKDIKKTDGKISKDFSGNENFQIDFTAKVEYYISDYVAKSTEINVYGQKIFFSYGNSKSYKLLLAGIANYEKKESGWSLVGYNITKSEIEN